MTRGKTYGPLSHRNLSVRCGRCAGCFRARRQAGREKLTLGRAMDISRFFIDRPRFAAVLSIIVFLLGLLAIFRLPVSEYPEQ